MRKEPKLKSVVFSYIGTSDDYDRFLKMVVRDYINEEIPQFRGGDYVGKVEVPKAVSKPLDSGERVW